MSTLKPETWSFARAKGEMSLAFANRTSANPLNPSSSVYLGTSSGVNFKFFEPNGTSVQLWRGYPLFAK
jgi:hypothetical protein